VVLPSLPLTPNGKLDRRALPAPDENAHAKRTYSATVGEIEAAIASIWQDLFQVAKIGRRDHFFELGGHSVLAVQFVSRLRKVLRVDVPLRELFVEPTVAGFAAALVEENKQLLHRNLVAIRPEGNLTPLFFVHPAGGEVAYARALAPSLDPELPVYGLAASGLLAGETPLRTVEEMAERYIQAMREIQPRGPFNLAGYSSGGIIAYEMANQLIGADERVTFLGLIDTSYSDGGAPQQRAFADEATYLLQRYEASVAAQKDSATLEDMRVLAAAGNLDGMLLRCQETGLIPPDIDQEALRRYHAVYMASDEALASYALLPIPAPVSLFVSNERADSDSQRRWHNLAGDRLRLIPVGGNHRTMIEPPHVQHLGTAITKALSAAANETAVYPELSYSPLIAVHTGASDLSPLFCVPGAGASVTAFCALADALDTARPVYGLQPRGLQDSLVPHIDVRSAARAYLSTIRAMCPNGPYSLLGHSFGGWIALEMAQSLTSSGARVDALIILDSEAPSYEAHTRKRYARIPLLLKLVELFEFNSQRPLNLSAADFEPLNHEGQLELLLARMIAARLMPPKTNIQVLRNMVRVFAANSNTSYVPAAVYEGPLHFVEATPEENPAAVAGWRRWAPNTTSWRSPGNHMTMLTPPHTGALAAWLRPLITR
ncbi:MAG TPA: alpha/beta fold hydrolase, partial [Steroidobacteraceae bacterium]